MARPMPPVSPYVPWPCSGTSTPTGLARAATTRRGALRSTTSTASSTIPTGSTTCSSPPPWEVANYEPRNPIESAKWNVLYLVPLLVTSLAYLVVVFHLWASLYRFALLGAISTVRSGLLRSLDQSFRVTCHPRFPPLFPESLHHRFYTVWCMIAGTCLGYKVVYIRHPVGVCACLGLG